MSKSLAERLVDAREVLDTAHAVMGRHPAAFEDRVLAPLRAIVDRRADIEHWREALHARAAAVEYLDGVETRVDAEDRVLFGEKRIKFGYARLISTLAWTTTTWGVADRVTALVGRMLCTADKGLNEAANAQLLSHFVGDQAKKAAAAPYFHSLRHTFGWPVGISYAIRNHFVHDGGHSDGLDFFEGESSASSFRIAQDSWERVLERVQGYGVESTQVRGDTAWVTSPCDDLRTVLRGCDREMDDALGILLGSGCHALKTHVGLMAGED